MYVIVTIAVIITCVKSITLPSDFPKCYIDDTSINQCIVDSANKLRPRLEEGIKELRLGPLKPLTFGNFNISHKSKDADFKCQSRKCTCYGMQHFDISELDFFPKKVFLRGVIKFGDIHVFSEYVLNGQILDIPVTGRGFFKGLINPSNVTFGLGCDLITLKGIKYCKLRNVKFKYEISNLVLSFDGLERASGSWGNTNSAFEQKSKEVAKVLAPVFGQIMKTHLVRYLKWFLSNVPFEDVFPST